MLQILDALVERVRKGSAAEDVEDAAQPVERVESGVADVWVAVARGIDQRPERLGVPDAAQRLRGDGPHRGIGVVEQPDERGHCSRVPRATEGGAGRMPSHGVAQRPHERIDTDVAERGQNLPQP